MTFANPAGLALLGLAIPIILLHILRPRRTPVTVSSTYLWRSIERPVSAAAPWQKLRWSPLLIAQLLAVALLALIVAKPVRLGAAALAEHTVFIVDASASMAAVDGAPDRVSSAAQRAIDLRSQLPAGGEASIVVAGERPRVVLTASDDAQAFSSAMRAIEPTEGRPDFAGAFLLAESLDGAASEIQYLFLSDGGITTEETKLLPPNTRYERIGEANANRAITRLTVESRGSGLHARVTVANTGGPEATQTLAVDVDGVRQSSQTIRVGTSSSIDVEIDLPAGDLVVARLEGGDLQRLDDEAFAVAARRPELKILLVGDQLFWRELLTSIPGAVVEAIAEPGATAPNGDGYDVVIYNETAVPADVAAPFIAVAAPGGVPGVAITGIVETPAITLLRSDDPLLSDVDITEVAIAEAQRVTTDFDVLVGAEAAPLLIRGSANQQPFLYLAHTLRNSNLPVQLAFPVLGDRMLDELAGVVRSTIALEVGATIPVDGLSSGQIIGPDNSRRDYSPGSVAVHANRAGFWTVSETDDEQQTERIVAVNPPSSESALTPAATLNSPLSADGRAKVATRQQHSLLPWFIWPMIALLVLETWLAWRRLGVSRRQWRLAVVLRAVVAAALLAALLAPTIRRSSDRVATVFLLDGSASLGVEGEREAVRWIREAMAERPESDLAAVVAFGGTARLDRVLQASSQFDSRAVVIDESATDMAAALRLGSAVLPTDARKRVVLIGDGRQTVGDVIDEAAALGEADIPVDVHTILSGSADDAAVTSIDVPTLARVGESIEVDVNLFASKPEQVSVILRRDGTTIETKTIDLVAGDNVVSFVDNAGESPGAVLRYQAIVQAPTDGQPKNDAAFAAVPVDGPAKILIVEGTSGEAAQFAAAMQAGGVANTVITAAGVPDVQELATYAGIVLVNVPADSLSADALRAITSAVRDLGRGLVTIGGERSYGVGGYRQSTLSELLPVDSEILDPKRRKSVAEVLSIDTSGSMANCHCAGEEMQRDGGGVNKTDISRAAAERTIAALTSNDQVGVVAWNSSSQWAIDLQYLPSEEVISDGLNSLRPDGNTNLLDSLTTASEALIDADAELKHIILFTDGFTDITFIGRVADQAAQLYEDHGITVSVLGTGEGAAPSLEEIAVAGHGRYYPGTDLDKVPQIMAEEAVIASRDFINEGEFFPEITSNDRVVANLSASPALLGYIAATSKPGATTMLRIGPDRDPLLASWQAGLGTVSSWMSDASTGWSQRWASWDGYVDFWSRVVKDTFQTGDIAGAVTARIDAGMLQLSVEGPNAFPDGAQATAIVAGPDGQRFEVPLERSANDTFVGSLSATRSGTYAVGVQVEADGSTVLATSTLASESYPAEYAPGFGDSQLMAKISELSGGRGEIAADAAFAAEGLSAGVRRIGLTGPLLLLAALLFPLAVLVSRLSLRGASVADARASLAKAGRSARRSLRSSLPTMTSDPVNTPAPPRQVAQPQAPPGLPPPAGTRLPPPSAPTPPSAAPQPPPVPSVPVGATSTMADLLARKRQRQASKSAPDEPASTPPP